MSAYPRAATALKQGKEHQFPEMETAAKLSSQPRTKSCVASGNGHGEAETGRLQAGTAVNEKIAPKSIVMEVADPIPLTGEGRNSGCWALAGL
jgi:hypothetical protein